MPYTAVYGVLPYRRCSQCLRVRVSDGPGTYRTPTVKFTAVTVYGTVRSPKIHKERLVRLAVILDFMIL